MGQTKTIEELLEMHGEELKEYLLALPAADRRRVCNELLKVKEEMEKQELTDNLHDKSYTK